MKLMQSFITLCALLCSVAYAAHPTFNHVGDQIDRFFTTYAASSNWHQVSAFTVPGQVNSGETLIFEKSYGNHSGATFKDSIVRVYVVSTYSLPSDENIYNMKLTGFYFERDIIPINDIRDAFTARGYTLHGSTSFPE